MITKLRHWWQEMRSSFWFVPALIVLGAVGFAAGLIAVDTSGQRRQLLLQQAELIAQVAKRSIPAGRDCERVEALWARLSRVLDGQAAAPTPLPA